MTAKPTTTPPTKGIIIGLEVHVYLRTASKLFCGCPANFLDAEPNTNICPTCTGQPGGKPWMTNAAALRAAVTLAHALGARIKPSFRFQRKHYFYPDSPSNYQRTGDPLATGGSLGGAKLTEMHLEEDPGAFDLHNGLVDYNRAGAPLLEIVTDPDFRSPAEARAALDDLRLAVTYLGVGDAAMGMKADANVSMDGHARAEIKNVSGARNVERALEAEIRRQRDAIAKGEPLVMETRHFDETSGRTVRLRVKETAMDYRFMPDPDLPTVVIPEEFLARARAREPPFARRARLAKEAGTDPAALSPLFEEEALVDTFEMLARRVPPAFALNFLNRDVRGELGYRKLGLADSHVDANDLGTLATALHAGHITAHQGTRVLRIGLDKGGLAAALEEEVAAAAGGGLEDELADAARAAVAENPKAVKDHAAGKKGAVNFLVGQVMRKLQGRGEPAAVREAVEAALARGD